MESVKKQYYEKRGQILVKNLRSRHFDAVYCDNAAEALEKALAWIPGEATVGWGGCRSVQQIGLLDAVKNGPYHAYDRDTCATPEERTRMMKKALTADVFLTGANALSLDGQMVNIDGIGNRVAAIVYGPDTVLVVAGMNKVMDTLEDAVTRARSVAAPVNNQRFDNQNPCKTTGSCADCKCETCICNQILVTRNCRPAGRIKFILVGEDLGF